MTQYHESETITITSFTFKVDANTNFIALLGLNRQRVELITITPSERPTSNFMLFFSTQNYLFKINLFLVPERTINLLPSTIISNTPAPRERNNHTNFSDSILIAVNGNLANYHTIAATVIHYRQ